MTRRLWGTGLLLLAALGLLTTTGCPGQGVASQSCSRISGCDSPCCDEERRCVEIVCEGASWICRRDGAQHRWMRDAHCPPPDQGLRSDGAIRCGLNAHPDNSGGCSCEQGYLNMDGTWTTGCEVADPTCSVVDCSKCPKGFCGQNAECRTIFSVHKCRCKDRFWLNTDGDWKNGCEVYTSTCAPNNCNSCYTGFCGPNANCMKNNCKCTASGWYDCDKVWEISGCECKGGCNGSACQ